MAVSSSSWPHSYSVVNNPQANWEETYMYFPYVNHFSSKNLLPAAPMTDPGFSRMTFFPSITIIFEGLIFKFLAFSNIDRYMILMHALFPLGSFWLLFLIFNRYIAISWSLLLAFFGITYYANFSLFGYFAHLGFHPGGAVSLASLSPLELGRIPFPCFTFFFFILTFYLSSSTRKVSRGWQLMITILWALNIYVYLFNFVVGTMFWFFYLIYLHGFRRKAPGMMVVKVLVENLLMVLIIISPLLLMKFFFCGTIEHEVFARAGLVSRNAGFIMNDWGLGASYLLPVLMLAVVVWVYCADYYELFYKFTPIFLLLLVEIVVSNLHLVLGKFFQPELLFSRITDYFLRYFYFVPAIYFLSQPYKKMPHSQASWSMARIILDFFQRIINSRRVIIVFMAIALVSMQAVFSAIKYQRLFESAIAPRMSEVKAEYDELFSEPLPKNAVGVSADIPVNLLIPVLSTRPTLLADAFSNYVLEQEILNRLVLFAHIYNWDEKRFLEFMMPTPELVQCNKNNECTFSDEMLNKGFGYWLLNNVRTMDAFELREYRERIIRSFNRFDLAENIKKYNVRLVQAQGAINPDLEIESVREGKFGRLYLLKHGSYQGAADISP